MPLLRGKPIADQLLARTAVRREEGIVTPGLAVILVGDDPGSEIYVRLKGEAARSIGLLFDLHSFSVEDNPEHVGAAIDRLNRDERIHGIILQLPLPAGWDADALIARIDPAKDADGFHAATLECYLAGDDAAMPVLPRAIQELIRASGIAPRGETAVAFVNSALFGRVIGHMLEGLGFVTTVLERPSAAEVRQQAALSRVIVSVCGIPGLVVLDATRPDAVVIDAGITRVGDQVVGDVVGDKEPSSRWITPIPGGVGPLTIACLLDRVTTLALHARSRSSVE